jgi:hypothetical protein
MHRHPVLTDHLDLDHVRQLARYRGDRVFGKVAGL